jgi:hypothetical protein
MLYRAGLLAKHIGFLQRLIFNFLVAATISSLAALIFNIGPWFVAVSVLAVFCLELAWFLIWTAIWFRHDTKVVQRSHEATKEYVLGSLVPASSVGPTYVQMRRLHWGKTSFEFRARHVEKAIRYSGLIGPKINIDPWLIRYYDPGLLGSFWVATGIELMLLIKSKTASPEERDTLTEALKDLCMCWKG